MPAEMAEMTESITIDSCRGAAPQSDVDGAILMQMMLDADVDADADADGDADAG
jgi:hypothetical protein